MESEEQTPRDELDPDQPLGAAVHEVTLGEEAAIGRIEEALFGQHTRVKVGRYEVEERIGIGGFGRVYLARDPQLQRKVALKLLHPGAGVGAQRRFLREARAMATVAHPNVVAVYDVGTFEPEDDEPTVYIAMEFIEGESLRKWLDRGPWPPGTIVEKLVQAGKGLVAAHGAGVIHRDFKPDNVLVGHDGRVRVADFGLARPETLMSMASIPVGDLRPNSLPLEQAHAMLGDDGEVRTGAGAVLGTPAYMAPEQHRAQPCTTRSDQFAFCVTLYQALYGERPFAGDNLFSLSEHVLAGDIRPPPQTTAVEERIREVLLRGLSVDPRDRYPSMEALLGALKPSKTRSRTVIAAVGLGVGALALFGGGVWLGRGAAGCEQQRRGLRGVWDETRRSELEGVVKGTDAPYAEHAWNQVAAMMDARADRFARHARRACEADSAEARVGPQGCAGRIHAEIEALGTVVDGSAPHVDGLWRLPIAVAPASRCDEADRDPLLEEELASAYADLAAAQSWLALGATDQARSRVTAAVQRAATVASADLVARSGIVEGRAYAADGDLEAAQRSFSVVYFTAVDAGDHATAASAAIELLELLAAEPTEAESALAWGAHAGTELRAAVGRPDLRARLALSQGIALLALGRVDEGHRALRRAIDFGLAAGREDLAAAGWSALAGSTPPGSDRRTPLGRAVEAWRRVLGPDHPGLIEPLQRHAEQLDGAAAAEVRRQLARIRGD